MERIDVLWGMSPVAGDGTFLRTRIPRVALGCTLDTEDIVRQTIFNLPYDDPSGRALKWCF
jgi:hypothetical protein